MKFSKILSNLLEEIFPDWREMFLSYKYLKKQLKLIYPKEGDEPPAKRLRLADGDGDCDGDGGDLAAAEINDDGEVTKEVADFVKLLREQIEKFNEFFLQKEEDYVIAWKELQDRIEKAKDANEDLAEVGRKVVDLHGEMVLLEIYSILNYTGLVKITKKHDKRSGAPLIRMPFIQSVLQQPFFSIDVLNKLVKECETMLDSIFSERELAEIQHLENTYVKLTLLALRVLREIRGGSSTVSEFSLPPL
ncbi:hypothetical protein UlMin_036016 [Ulmus minor]